MRKIKGFTLIELLIVLAIIAILAILSMGFLTNLVSPNPPVYGRVQEKIADFDHHGRRVFKIKVGREDTQSTEFYLCDETVFRTMELEKRYELKLNILKTNIDSYKLPE